MTVSLPGFVPDTFDETYGNLVGAATRLGGESAQSEVSWWARGGLLDGIDLIKSPGAASDANLANWWSEGCPVREAVWAVAADGCVSSVDSLLWMLKLAEHRQESAFCGLLATDLCDVTQTVLSVTHGDDLDAMLRSLRSPVRLRDWLDGARIRPASTVGDGVEVDGTQTVTRAWLHGRVADRDECFDTVLHAAIGGTAVVVELDDHYRRHVLMPVGAIEPDSLDSDHFCLDLACGRDGWFGRLGRWTWAPRTTVHSTSMLRPTG